MSLTDLPTRQDASSEPELRQDEVFERANLTEAQTGVPGIVYVSTQEGSHGPRVKYFVRPGRTQPSYSVAISDDPKLLVSSLDERTVRRTLPLVTAFVRENRDVLLAFWNEGDSWTDPQVNAFKVDLKPVG